MKQLLIPLLLLISISVYAQVGSLSQSVYRSRVNDSTTVNSGSSSGYGAIYWNNQATIPGWRVWNGSSFDIGFPGTGGGAWGTITGTLADQTDLQTALDAKLTAAAAGTTGTAIAFVVPQIYGSDGSPETGNITINTSGLVVGMTQLVVHNNGTQPTFGSECKIISGTYATGDLNYIYLQAISSTVVLVTISQQL